MLSRPEAAYAMLFLRIRSGGKGSVNDIVIGENGD